MMVYAGELVCWSLLWFAGDCCLLLWLAGDCCLLSKRVEEKVLIFCLVSPIPFSFDNKLCVFDVVVVP